MQCGGMKLHEFGVGDHRARPCRHGDALTPRLPRIGGHGEQLTHTARRKHDRTRLDEQRLRCRCRMGRPREDPGSPSVFDGKFMGRQSFHHADGGAGAHGGDKRLHDRLARLIALHMDDAAVAMRRLAANGKLALNVAVERHAEPQQILDADGGFARDRQRRFLVHRARACRNGVRGMGFRCVTRLDGGGYAALRPGTRGAIADRRTRENSDRTWREFQRSEEARKPCTDDQNVTGIDDVALCHDSTSRMCGLQRVGLSCRD